MRFSQIAPPELVSNAPRLICTGREETIIEGHSGLFSYETSCIRVRTRMGVWTVEGENLLIEYFGTEDLKIKGRVDGIRLDGEG